MERLVGKSEQWAVRILCAIALVVLGLSHQPPALAATGFDPADYAEYVLPDGTLPTLCVTSNSNRHDRDGQHHHSQGGKTDCEACRISAVAMVPPAPIHAERVFLAQELAKYPFPVGEITRQLYPPNTGPRAPPFA
ncbi:DUF2946 family protein [Neorhizobium sp. AL 9.2.2]|uniref:DUF2946 family protein n=1 Tax=Neorhizobium sp. AL 9.2.2 TaxID=2712894 RepID=UPI001573618C|nr:hypothetical protein [Neorhizobium sp. AL 9.2.2]NSY19433.1 hypothetical protein [Neorhizobium sp. AL 9.2.2]